MSEALTISGVLPGGADVAGKVHRDFTLRLPTVRDNIEAIDEVGASNNLALSAAILTRQILKLGDLKPEEITYEVVSRLHPEDYNLLEARAMELEKKRKALQQPASTPSASVSPSAAPA